MSIVRRVDHVLLLTDAPEPLLRTLTGTLGLPLSVAFELRGTFASGLAWAGNSQLECIRIGPPVATPSAEARFAGIAFEPAALPGAIAEMDARSIPHGAPAAFPHDGEMRRWTNVAIDGMLPHAMIFLCDFAENQAPLRDEWRRELEDASGGALGIEALRTIDISVTDIAAAIARWDALLQPAISPQRGTWHCGDGPSLRLVPGARDAIASLTFDVRSLDEADAWLRRHQMHGARCGDEVRIDPAAVQGLDLRLREASR